VEGLEDVQRFFLIPHGKQRHRLVVVGRKRPPEITNPHERNWTAALVDPAGVASTLIELAL
jgi:hypothetical protein